MCIINIKGFTVFKYIKMIVIVILLPSFAYSYSISLKKGWNLKGFNEKVDVTKMISSNKELTTIWGYSSSSSKWLYVDRVSKKNTIPLRQSATNSGLWIHVKTDTTINMKNNFISKPPPGAISTPNITRGNYIKTKMITKNRSYSGVRGR